jgi:hypothetical protein
MHVSSKSSSTEDFALKSSGQENNFAAKAQSYRALQCVASHTLERCYKSNQHSQSSTFMAQALQQARDSLPISSPELRTRDPPTSSFNLARTQSFPPEASRYVKLFQQLFPHCRSDITSSPRMQKRRIISGCPRFDVSQDLIPLVNEGEFVPCRSLLFSKTTPTAI